MSLYFHTHSLGQLNNPNIHHRVSHAFIHHHLTDTCKQGYTNTLSLETIENLRERNELRLQMDLT